DSGAISESLRSNNAWSGRDVKWVLNLCGRPLKLTVRLLKHTHRTVLRRYPGVSMPRQIIRTHTAPTSPPTYSQGVRAAGVVFVSGHGPFDSRPARSSAAPSRNRRDDALPSCRPRCTSQRGRVRDAF